MHVHVQNVALSGYSRIQNYWHLPFWNRGSGGLSASAPMPRLLSLDPELVQPHPVGGMMEWAMYGQAGAVGKSTGRVPEATHELASERVPVWPLADVSRQYARSCIGCRFSFVERAMPMRNSCHTLYNIFVIMAQLKPFCSRWSARSSSSWPFRGRPGTISYVKPRSSVAPSRWSHRMLLRAGIAAAPADSTGEPGLAPFFTYYLPPEWTLHRGKGRYILMMVISPRGDVKRSYTDQRMS
ncbi:hypothetical protein EDB86DRAFT_1446113 [Lactarius hatsudake]|nr:hypothetical protein EDB86DRAFT_1446113 [Lactarius hatsudake]